MFKTLHPLSANSSRHLSILLELPYTSREGQGVTVSIRSGSLEPYFTSSSY